MQQSNDAIIQEAQNVYRELRRVAASDPRAARQRLVDLVRSNDPTLETLLEFMRPASEGRMRNLVPCHS